MVRRSPPRKIRHSLWQKFLRRRRRGQAQPHKILKRRQLAKGKQPRPPRRRRRRVVRQVPIRERTTQIYAPTPLYVHISRLSIGLLGTAVIAGTIMSAIKPPTISTPVTTTKKTAPRVAPENMVLKQKLTELTSRYPGLQPSFLVIAADGSKTEINANQVLPAASTIKIPLLIALFQQIDRGQIKLDEQLTLQPAMVAEGSGDLAKSPLGSKFSVAEIATKMITISDNTAANMLIDRLGGQEKLNLQFRSWGLLNTTLKAPLPDFAGNNITSPPELGKILLGLKNDGILSATSRLAVLEILHQTQRNTMLPAGINDKQVQVAHKTGELAKLVADVGLVEMSNGQTYLVAAMVQRPDGDQRAEALIRQFSQTVFGELGTKPSTSPSVAASNSNR
jgi:beta-lactamase class A